MSSCPPASGCDEDAAARVLRERVEAQRDPFADDVLERLARSNMEYQREHGHYIVPLAERLLAARAEIERLRAKLAEYDKYVGEFTRHA